MPYKAPRICRECQKVATANGYCSIHQSNNHAARYEQARQQARRDSGLDALYRTKQWKLQTRPAILARDPLCKLAILCEGKSASVHVDHVLPADIYVRLHGGDTDYFYDDRNLQGTCLRCHSYKTAKERARSWNPATCA